MEDTLGAIKIKNRKSAETVLILVLMEDTLGALSSTFIFIIISLVLILVLMEDTLGASNNIF